MKYPTSDQVAIWDFSELFALYGLSNIIIMDVGGIFTGVSKKITVHTVAQENHKGCLHQWLQGLFFIIYACNSVPVDGTNIYWSFVALGRESPFSINVGTSSVVPRYLVSEGQKVL